MISSHLASFPNLSLPTPKLLDAEVEMHGEYGLSCLFICNALRSGVKGCRQTLEAYRNMDFNQACLAARNVSVAVIHLGIGLYLKNGGDNKLGKLFF